MEKTLDGKPFKQEASSEYTEGIEFELSELALLQGGYCVSQPRVIELRGGTCCSVNKLGILDGGIHYMAD